MEENNNQENTQLNPKKRKSVKWKVYFVVAMILVGGGAYGYYWYKQTSAFRSEARAVLDRAEKFDILKNAVNDEWRRCENFISQKEGDFGSFEYCKKFINWTEVLPILQ